VLAVANDVVFA
jgi:uncharacterized Zn ribbon protein